MKKQVLFIGVCALLVSVSVGVTYLLTRHQEEPLKLVESSGGQSISELSESSERSQTDSSEAATILSSSESLKSSSTEPVKQPESFSRSSTVSSFISQVQPATPEPSSSESAKYPLNINTATVEEFMTLPGIDEEQARLIVLYRERAGNYEQLSDLLKVKGMTMGRYNEIENLITV